MQLHGVLWDGIHRFGIGHRSGSPEHPWETAALPCCVWWGQPGVTRAVGVGPPGTSVRGWSLVLPHGEVPRQWGPQEQTHSAPVWLGAGHASTQTGTEPRTRIRPGSVSDLDWD